MFETTNWAMTVLRSAAGLVVLATVGLTVAVGGPGALSVDSALAIGLVFGGWTGLALAAGGAALAPVQIATSFRPRLNAEA